MKIQTYNNRHYFIGFTEEDLMDLRNRKPNNIRKVYIFMIPSHTESTQIIYRNLKTIIDKESFRFLCEAAERLHFIINVYTMNLYGDYHNILYLYYHIIDRKYLKSIIKVHTEPNYEAYINYCNLIHIYRKEEALYYDIFKPYYDYRDIEGRKIDESMIIQSNVFYRCY